MMANPDTDKITLQAAMTKDDYSRYFAVMNRRESNWMNVACYAGALFTAIPVALVFRSVGTHFSARPDDAELIGKLSLFAFLLGVTAIIFAGVIARRLAIGDFVEATLNAYEPKTIVLDATGVTTIGRISQASWSWPAVSQLTLERGLTLIWIGGRTALAIPDRSFASPQARDAAIAFIRARLSEATYGSSSPAA